MNEIKQNYLCLSAQQYRVVDENTGDVNEGISVWYLPSDNLNPATDLEAKERGQVVKGIKAGKMALPLEMASKLKDLPAMYEVTMEMRMVAQRAQVRPVDLDFLSHVKLSQDKKAA